MTSNSNSTFTTYCGIELIEYYESRYRSDYYDDVDQTIFDIKDEEFTPENVKSKIEEHIFDIFDSPKNNIYFRFYKIEPGMNHIITGTPGLSVKETLTLIGGEAYYDQMLKFYHKKMFQHMCETSGMSPDELLEHCCEDHRAIFTGSH